MGLRVVKGLSGIVFALLLACGCTVPKDAVILSDGKSSITGTKPIPSQWDGRLLAVGGTHVSLGGEEFHAHSVPHTHSSTTNRTAANPSLLPLGVDVVVAGGSHNHSLSSGVSERETNGASSNLPRSRELSAALAKHGLWRAPQGMIICYLALDTPKDWLECDGSSGTPDVKGLYVMLRSKAAAEGVVGSETHTHTNFHGHRWNAGPPQLDSDQALAVDHKSTNAPPNARAAPYDHTHVVDDPGVASILTAATNLPPSLSIRFLIASRKGLKLPKGALLAFGGDVVPLGWNRFKWDQWALNPRMIRGADAQFPPNTLFGSATHRHTLPHTHQLVLGPSAAAAVDIRIHDGAPVAGADHTHTINISSEPATADGNSVPPFVATPFIIKD